MDSAADKIPQRLVNLLGTARELGRVYAQLQAEGSKALRLNF
jgi:hypothetical protein